MKSLFGKKNILYFTLITLYLLLFLETLFLGCLSAISLYLYSEQEKKSVHFLRQPQFLSLSFISKPCKNLVNVLVLIYSTH